MIILVTKRTIENETYLIEVYANSDGYYFNFDWNENDTGKFRNVTLSRKNFEDMLEKIIDHYWFKKYFNLPDKNRIFEEFGEFRIQIQRMYTWLDRHFD